MTISAHLSTFFPQRLRFLSDSSRLCDCSSRMHIMAVILFNVLLFLALEPCLTYAQESTETYTNIGTTSMENENLHAIITTEIPSATPVAIVTEPQTEPDLYFATTGLAYQMSTMTEHPTTVETTQPNTEMEQTTPEPVFETTTAATATTTITTNAQVVESTTMEITTVPVKVETTATGQITTDAPSTRQYETTVGITTTELTSQTSATEKITTVTDAMSTESTDALNPTSITSQSPIDRTESPAIMSDPEDTSKVTSTGALTSTSQMPQNMPHTHSYLMSDVTTHFTTVITDENVMASIVPIPSNWLLIIIVCVLIICVLCIGMMLFVQQRKKHASRSFGPAYMNGQSKRSKKKKGAEDDAWAGPVNLEGGLESDPEVQESLLPKDGKQDGDDMVLSTFSGLDTGNMSNGGVGGEGTKEAKKWEEQEPLLYIDEDVDDNSVEENERSKGDDKCEAKQLNSGETFCLTTAV